MLLWVPEGTDSEYLEGLPDTVVIGELPRSSSILPEDAARVEFVIVPWMHNPVLFKEQLAQMPSLRVLQTFSAGVETVLPIVPPGVILCNGRGLHDSAVSEWCVGAILAVYNKFAAYIRLAEIGKWNHIETDTLEGRAVTILGYGSIGKAVADRLAPFGVLINRVATTSRIDSFGNQIHALEEIRSILPLTDVLINLLPFGENTAKVVDRALLSQLPDGALVINAGRGGTVDTDALIAELSTGRLTAVLDVTDPEPIPDGHPLWSTPNLILTQHSSGDSSDYLAKVYPFVHEQIARYMAGEPLLNIVTGG